MSYRSYLRDRAVSRSHAFDLRPYVENASLDPQRKGTARKVFQIIVGAAVGWAVFGGAIWLALRLG